MADSPPQVRVLPVLREAAHVYATADSASVTTSLSGFMEVSFISARSQIVSQSFEVLGEDQAAQTLGNPTVQANPTLVEVAAIRMAPPVLVETAMTLLRHMLLNGATKTEILAQLRANQILD